MGGFFEIYLTQKYVQKEDWLELINKVTKYSSIFNSISLIITKELNQIRFFIKSKYNLPTTINRLNSFLLEKTNNITIPKEALILPYFTTIGSNIIDIINNFEIKNKGEINLIEIKFHKTLDNKIKKKVNIYTSSNDIVIKYKLYLTSISSLLSIDFEGNKRYLYKSAPKYLDTSKVLNILNNDNSNAILKVNTFPYASGGYYLNEFNYSFNKHSVIFGASGSGKSKFISLLIDNIRKNNNLKENYKFVVIDPHAALENDIGAFSKTIDFNTFNDSIDLFSGSNNDIVANTEIYLDLFKSLISDQYNSKLERVLRHSTYLLLNNNSFNFTNLRKLLLDIEYRNGLINEAKFSLPISVIDFFLNDFNELKTRSYSESISPIISFIDEMSMLPVFNSLDKFATLNDTLQNNFVTLFSLDRTKTGDKITKTIAGLVMQNVLNIIQSRSIKEHIIFIIDEVAVIENPILSKFLSEARKYNLSLILAGQHFNQISKELKDSIFANVINYYIFRVSKSDAITLVDNINMKIPMEDTKDKKTTLLSELPNRTCVARIEVGGKLLPAFLGTTIDYESKPRIKIKTKESNIYFKDTPVSNFNFNTTTDVKLGDILRSNSSSRKEIKNER